MLKKKILSLIFFIIVTNCDYKPVYLDNKETNLDIVILNQSGDNEINNYILKQLKQKSKNNSSKKFNVNLNSNFQKIIIAKNSKGTATDFEIKIKVDFEIQYIDKKQNFSIEEKIKYKKMNNSYELNNYEKMIKKNLTTSITNKLIARLTTFE